MFHQMNVDFSATFQNLTGPKDSDFEKHCGHNDAFIHKK